MNTFFFNKIQTTNLPDYIPPTPPTPPTHLPISPNMTTTTTITTTSTPKEIGFIILRHVNSAKTNQYWKECYRCIRYFYPSNKILIVDDNSDTIFLTCDANNIEQELHNTTIIQSEYSKRGEFLPYYYYLKNKFCDIAVILHDSVFIQQPINFQVDEYKMLWHFPSYLMKDGQSSGKQLEQIRALNNGDLNHMYEYFYLNKFNGCFGAMSIITHDYLSEINNIFKIDKLLPHITCRISRCAFERVFSFLLIYKQNRGNVANGGSMWNSRGNIKHQSLLGDIVKYCKWGITFDDYIKYRHRMKLPIVKVWTGR
jgi:hypothetical protein